MEEFMSTALLNAVMSVWHREFLPATFSTMLLILRA